MAIRKSISLNQELIEIAEKHARVNGQTFSGLVRISLEKYLEECRTKQEE